MTLTLEIVRISQSPFPLCLALHLSSHKMVWYLLSFPGPLYLPNPHLQNKHAEQEVPLGRELHLLHKHSASRPHRGNSRQLSREDAIVSGGPQEAEAQESTISSLLPSLDSMKIRMVQTQTVALTSSLKTK